MKKTALVTHEECLQHVTPPGHPEQVARLEYILEALKDIKKNHLPMTKLKEKPNLALPKLPKS